MSSTFTLPSMANNLAIALPLAISLLATAVDAKGGGSSSKKTKKKKKISTGAIIGIVVGIIFVIILLLLVAWCMSKRKTKKLKKSLEGGNELKPVEGAGAGGSSGEYYGAK